MKLKKFWSVGGVRAGGAPLGSATGYKSARDQSEEDDTGNQFQEKRPQKRSQKIS